MFRNSTSRSWFRRGTYTTWAPISRVTRINPFAAVENSMKRRPHSEAAYKFSSRVNTAFICHSRLNCLVYCCVLARKSMHRVGIVVVVVVCRECLCGVWRNLRVRSSVLASNRFRSIEIETELRSSRCHIGEILNCITDGQLTSVGVNVTKLIPFFRLVDRHWAYSKTAPSTKIHDIAKLLDRSNSVHTELLICEL